MLFRQEAIDYFQQDSSHGEILVRSPVVLWGCSLVALGLCAAIFAVVYQATYTPRIQPVGKVVQDADAAGKTAFLVELWVPSHALPALPVGRRVPLHLAALSATEQPGCYGLVKEVFRVPVRRVEGEAQYRVSLQPKLLVPDSTCSTHSLSVGMEVTTDIILGKIRLLDWIIQPGPSAEKKP